MHCRFVLDELLLPLCNEGCVKTTTHSQRAVVLIENRIDKQWLFTLLNTWLMCPKDSQFVLIADKNSTAEARELLNRYASGLNAIVWDATQIVPGVQLTEHASFNAMLKRTEFWKQMPHENLLFIQTDALVAKPIHPFFFNFSYLGAPFLPRQHSEYFTMRDAEGQINRFFKPIRQSMGRRRDVYPHLHGNRTLNPFENGMETICKHWGESSSDYKQKTSSSAVTSARWHTCSAGYRSSIFYGNNLQPECHWRHACCP